jgi:hypothetical protein
MREAEINVYESILYIFCAKLVHGRPYISVLTYKTFPAAYPIVKNEPNAYWSSVKTSLPQRRKNEVSSMIHSCLVKVYQKLI